jgi:hypothetical protein
MPISGGVSGAVSMGTGAGETFRPNLLLNPKEFAIGLEPLLSLFLCLYCAEAVPKPVQPGTEGPETRYCWVVASIHAPRGCGSHGNRTHKDIVGLFDRQTNMSPAQGLFSPAKFPIRSGRSAGSA